MRKLVMVFLVAFLFVGCANKGEVQTESPYLILYAFDSEGVRLSERMDIDTVEIQLGREVKLGELAGKPIVLAESGVGMTNAAMSVQRLIDVYHPCAVLMTGIAGALDSLVRIGDVVVCDNWIEHDYVYEGSDGRQHMPLYAYDPQSDSVAAISEFHVDVDMFEVICRMNTEDLELKDIEGRRPELHVGGTGVSGNAFIDSKEKRESLIEEFSAQITDMESAAVVHVCAVNNVPVVVFRSASDLAGGSGSGSAGKELRSFFEVAADNSAAILEAVLKGM